MSTMSRTYRSSEASRRWCKKPKGHVQNEVSELNAKEEGAKYKPRYVPTSWDDICHRNESGQVYRALHRMFDKNMPNDDICNCLVNKWKLSKQQAINMVTKHREWHIENKERSKQYKERMRNDRKEAEQICKRVIGNIDQYKLNQLHQVVYRLRKENINHYVPKILAKELEKFGVEVSIIGDLSKVRHLTPIYKENYRFEVWIDWDHIDQKYKWHVCYFSPGDTYRY